MSSTLGSTQNSARCEDAGWVLHDALHRGDRPRKTRRGHPSTPRLTATLLSTMDSLSRLSFSKAKREEVATADVTTRLQSRYACPLNVSIGKAREQQEQYLNDLCSYDPRPSQNRFQNPKRGGTKTKASRFRSKQRKHIRSQELGQTAE